jgi:cell division protein FtsI/penicillin-binding protein 2
VGAFPAEAPTRVVLVSVASNDESYGGGKIAAPAFRRVVERLLRDGLAR